MIRDQQAGWHGAIPNITSLVKSILHVMMGGGSREGSGTIMSNTNCQSIEN